LRVLNTDNDRWINVPFARAYGHSVSANGTNIMPRKGVENVRFATWINAAMQNLKLVPTPKVSYVGFSSVYPTNGYMPSVVLALDIFIEIERHFPSHLDPTYSSFRLHHAKLAFNCNPLNVGQRCVSQDNQQSQDSKRSGFSVMSLLLLPVSATLLIKGLQSEGSDGECLLYLVSGVIIGFVGFVNLWTVLG
jgi:hypothetical protein